MPQALQQEPSPTPESDSTKPDRLSAANSPSMPGPLSNKNLHDIWLAWVCQMVAGVQAGCLVEQAGNKLSKQLALWPESLNRPDQLINAALQVCKTGKLLVRSRVQMRAPAPALVDVIAVPIQTESHACIVVLQLIPRSREQQESVIQLIKWVSLWLDTVTNLADSESSKHPDPQNPLIAALLEHRTLHAAGVELVNAIAKKYQCERVSLGIKRSLLVRLLALSQTTEFDSRKALIRHLEAAMEEALDQEAVITVPEVIAPELTIVRAHEELARVHGSLSTCTIPFEVFDGTMGALTLERDKEQPFTAASIESLNNLLLTVRPVLSLISSTDQPIHTRISHGIKARYQRLYRSRSRRFRLILPVALVVLIAGLFFPVTHKVVARAIVEGADQQQLVAPESGFIKAVFASAGDRVVKGQIIATLEDSELLIEQQKWKNELEKLETGYIQALSNKDRIELGVMQSRKRQAQAELDLVSRKISRVELRSPFDGVIVSGDLSQSLGAPVEMGHLLFEIASLDDFRLMLEIEEDDVFAIETGQKGLLRISALPKQTYETTLVSAVPVAITSDRKTVFRMEATLEESDLELRPGMRGYARIALGKKPFISSLTMNIRNQMVLWFWKFGWVK